MSKRHTFSAFLGPAAAIWSKMPQEVLEMSAMSMMREYATFHRNRTNLLGHVFVVPLFVAGACLSVALFWGGQPLEGGLALLGPLISMAAQAFLHGREDIAPKPFTGPLNFIGRLLGEQFFKFPYFVLSGAFFRAWREAAQPSTPPPD
jgi:hypothetical protein